MHRATDETLLCRLPVGAEILPQGGVRFRVWAPERRTIEVIFESTGDGTSPVELVREDDGYFSAEVPAAKAGDLYWFRADGDEKPLYPDPASRFQPRGPLGPSQAIDPDGFRWTDGHWPGVSKTGQVIYEMHIGTFTPEGTWRAAEQQLAELADTGITMLEIMPVADFVGDFGWGYDGVNLFAPTRLYGTPDDFRSFVDRTHALGIGVLLDVVYNHFGMVGNLQLGLSRFYRSNRHQNEWGDPVNFDGENAKPVREFVLANVRYWIEEFHVDGYRFDATQAIFDESPRHILGEMATEARRAAAGKNVFLLSENEPQDVRTVRTEKEGGFGMDALWNDDFHHTALVRLTGRREAYYGDYFGTPEEFVAVAKYGFLYQGQFYPWQGKRRGTPTFGLDGDTFINYLENHDQLANSARGERVWQLTSPGRFRAATALLLLLPGTPLLFQGQEFSASSPFVFFLNSPPGHDEQVASGRAAFLGQFPSLASPEAQAGLPNPGDRSNFERSKLDFGDRQRHAASYQLHRDLIWLRRRDPVFAAQTAGMVDGARLSNDAFVLRYFGGEHGDRLLLINFGYTLDLHAAPQPLLAAPENSTWRLLWSSEQPAYGGYGTPDVVTDNGWRLPGEAAVVMTSLARETS